MMALENIDDYLFDPVEGVQDVIVFNKDNKRVYVEILKDYNYGRFEAEPTEADINQVAKDNPEAAYYLVSYEHQEPDEGFRLYLFKAVPEPS